MALGSIRQDLDLKELDQNVDKIVCRLEFQRRVRQPRFETHCACFPLSSVFLSFFSLYILSVSVPKEAWWFFSFRFVSLYFGMSVVAIPLALALEAPPPLSSTAPPPPPIPPAPTPPPTTSSSSNSSRSTSRLRRSSGSASGRRPSPRPYPESYRDAPANRMCQVCTVVPFQFHHFGAFVCNRYLIVETREQLRGYRLEDGFRIQFS
jgi:hypothetical protein